MSFDRDRLQPGLGTRWVAPKLWVSAEVDSYLAVHKIWLGTSLPVNAISDKLGRVYTHTTLHPGYGVEGEIHPVVDAFSSLLILAGYGAPQRRLKIFDGQVDLLIQDKKDGGIKLQWSAPERYARNNEMCVGITRHMLGSVPERGIKSLYWPRTVDQIWQGLVRMAQGTSHGVNSAA